MPSLIYITRIRSLSEELAQNLRSAGCHVESFKPGAITRDECLLAMTPEAADAALHPERLRAEPSREHGGIPFAPDTNQQLGPEADVWNCLKALVAKEFSANREPVPQAAPAVEIQIMAAEAGRPAVPSRQERASERIARIEPSPIVAVSSSEVSRYMKKIRPVIQLRPVIQQCYRVFHSPLSTVVAVLVFAVLYRALVPPSATGSSGRTSHRSTPVLTVSAEPSRRTVQRLQRHLYLESFVAEDFTNHFDPHPRSDATQNNSELRHPHRDSTRKRIVVD
jgi:hypothetical protein